MLLDNRITNDFRDHWNNYCIDILDNCKINIFEVQNGKFEPLILAGTTVLCIIMFLIISLVYVSCIDQITVEVLDPWRIIDVQGGNESKSISIIELDNPNKQTIQTINNNEERHDMRYSTINVV